MKLGGGKVRKIAVRVVPSSKRVRVVEEVNRLKIYVTAPPEKGKANKSVIDIVSKRFGKSKAKIRILKGETARDKILEVLE